MKLKNLFNVLFVLAILLLPSNVYPQKFVKYIFLDNKVKVVVKKDFSVQAMPDKGAVENRESLRYWLTKNEKASLKLYMMHHQANGDIVRKVQDIWRLFPESEGQNEIKSKTIVINRNQKVGVMEYSATESSNQYFYCIFGVKFQDEDFLFFIFQCLTKDKDKYYPALQETIRTLTVQ